MVEYSNPDLFFDHETTHWVIVNSGATVTGRSGTTPLISDETFVLTEDNLTEDEIEIGESLNSSNNLKFGSMEASMFQVDIFDSDSIPHLKDEEIDVYLYFDDDSSTLFKVGRYIVKNDTFSDDRATRTIIAYDLINYLRDYDITEWYNEVYEGVTTRTIKYLRDSLFAWLDTDMEDYTIEQEETNLINDDWEVEKSINSDTITFGFWMERIAEANGVFPHINRQGVFCYVGLKWYDEPAVMTYDDDLIIPPVKYGGSDKDITVWGIGYVVVYDGNNKKLAKVGSSSRKFPSNYYIVDSFVFTNNRKQSGWSTNLEAALSKLREAITHLRYKPFEGEFYGNLCYEVGDRIDVELNTYDEETDGTDDNTPIVKTFYTYILERTFIGLNDFDDTFYAKGDKKQPKYKIRTDKWNVKDTDTATSGEGTGGVSILNDEHDRRLIQLLRNLGFRILDEPSNVEVVYNKQDQQVEIKWTDPQDFIQNRPIPAVWAKTIVVRKEGSAPIHQWGADNTEYGGDILVISTTRDEYSQIAFVDDTIEPNKRYYYAIMPGSLYLDDADNPIYHYNWTMAISVDTQRILIAPTIMGLSADGTTVGIMWMIPVLEIGSYENITLAAKKDSIPKSIADADKTMQLPYDSSMIIQSASMSDLEELSAYYFVIFIEDDQGNTATSEPMDCVTEQIPKFEITSIANASTSFVVNYRINDYSTIENYRDIKLVAKANGIPSNKNDGYIIDITNNFYESQDSSWSNVDNEVAYIGLPNAESYGFKIFADDDISNSMIKETTQGTSPYTMNVLIWFSGAFNVGRPEQDRHYGYIPCYFAVPISQIDYQVGIWTDESSTKFGNFYIRSTKDGENLISQEFSGSNAESPKTFTCELNEAISGLKWLVFNDPADSGWNPAVLQLAFYTQ